MCSHENSSCESCDHVWICRLHWQTERVRHRVKGTWLSPLVEGRRDEASAHEAVARPKTISLFWFAVDFTLFYALHSHNWYSCFSLLLSITFPLRCVRALGLSRFPFRSCNDNSQWFGLISHASASWYWCTYVMCWVFFSHFCKWYNILVYVQCGHRHDTLCVHRTVLVHPVDVVTDPS